MLKVTWFRNPHEQRNDLLRFGLMRLHQRRALDYTELPLAACTEFGFSSAVAEHVHRHTSVLLVRDGQRAVRCLVDSEDSYFWMCPLISEVDLYFCSGYNSDFFERRSMLQAYPWQSEPEIAFYRARTDELVELNGAHFGKARRFVPIGPSLVRSTPVPTIPQKLFNARHKLATMVSKTVYWRNELHSFEHRYAELLALRSSPVNYDVVLLDTLWGWPRHRLKLHLELKRLSDQHQIRSALNWSPPVRFDGSEDQPLDRDQFPITTGAVENYEPMLSQSRLAVFATGFHWGWRSIMSLALMFGLPVYMDKPLLEPWFDFGGFEVFPNLDDDWPDLERHLSELTDADLQRIKQRNQQRYDEVMSPDAVARYFVETALS